MTSRVEPLPRFDIRRLALVIPIALAMVLLAVRPGQAADIGAQDDPLVFLNGFSSEAIALFEDQEISDKKREDEFRRLFTAGFDVDAISRFVLGRYWRGATKEQRREYRQLFEDFIVATYARRLKGQSGDNFKLGKIREQTAKRAIITSEIKRTDGTPIILDWRLRNKRGEWRIVDISIEGISMAITQRSEFYTVIGNNGGQVEGLLQKLREKTQVASQ